ncbi:PDF receptor-like [Schistocerca americana]|uniref:PDF receptor-like n=1 Tax=Schistocerca americana TaxID=7009 RepID=UPI001F503010|nr:PDF receptor-like [Schistocerca americana]
MMEKAGGASSETVLNTSLETCIRKYQDFVSPNGGLYCNWTWDQVLCWPPTRAGTTAKQRCPSFNGLDQTKFAVRRCSLEGRWEGRDPSSPQGWTNYTPCYLPETLQLMRRLYAGSEAAAKVKLEIAERTRALEIVGFSVSLAALLVALAIFCRFRSLRNNRTRIHRNLFVAMVVQVVIRLTLYADQAVVRGGGGGGVQEQHRQGIDNTPVLCEASYVLLEYARTSMFMWMFVEGLYLHNAVTVTVFQESSFLLVYSLLGWGVPVLMTAAWAATTAVMFGGSNRCWWGYNLTPYFWILEGPRLGVILLNFLFLLNIIRVLVVKLRQSHTSEIEQVRKAVRAAVVLLPLLGITNLVNMADAPLDRAAWEFALWSYATHFLVSFQGFFIACLYCFINGEVRAAIVKSVSVYLLLRRHHQASAGRRMSVFSGVYVAASARQPPPVACTALVGAAGAGGGVATPTSKKRKRKRKCRADEKGDGDDCEDEMEKEQVVVGSVAGPVVEPRRVSSITTRPSTDGVSVGSSESGAGALLAADGEPDGAPIAAISPSKLPLGPLQ